MSYVVQQKGDAVFVVVDTTTSAVVHWTNSRKRAAKVVRQLKSNTRKKQRNTR